MNSGYTILYRWKLKQGSEGKFEKAWTAVTEHYLANFGSLGSRLHRGDDGIWYAYAQWPSEEHRKRAFLTADLEVHREDMQACIEKRFPEVVLDIVSDGLR